MATQTIKIKRNSTPYSNEAAAYTALNAMTLLAGEPVVLFYNTTTKDTAGKGGAIGSIYAVGTTGQQGAYQAFATWEDMYEVYQDVETFKSAITVEDDEVTINRKVTIGGDVAAHENSFTNLLLPADEPTNPSDANGYYLYVGKLGEGADTPEGGGGGGADLSSLVIKFTGRADESYSPNANNVVTIPSFAEISTVTELLNRVVALEEVDVESIAQGVIDEIKGKANGLATLGDDGKVPTSQLPSYVDDVLEYASKSAFPSTGETGKIYVAQDTNITYRWGGTAYVEISASLALGETSSTAYAGDKGKANADAITVLKGRKVSAGAGLSGGGDLNADRTISMGTPSTITSTSTNSASGTTHTHAIDAASTSKAGIVQLDNATNSTSTTKAATANAVKTAYDKANSAQNDLDTLEAKTITGAGAAQSSGTLSGGVTITVDYDNASIKYGADKKLYVDVIDGGTF